MAGLADYAIGMCIESDIVMWFFYMAIRTFEKIFAVHTYCH